MSDLLNYRGYQGSVAYSAEDHLLHGRILGIRDFVLYDGEDVATVEQNFRGAVDEYLRFCKEDGRNPESPAPVQADFQVPQKLQQRVWHFAEQRHIQVNSVLEQALNSFLEHAE